MDLIKHTDISIDLDSIDETELAIALEKLRRAGFTKDLRYGPSSNKGCHITARCDLKDGLTTKEWLKLREECADDYLRLKYDRIACKLGKQCSVLFDSKIVKRRKNR